MKRKKKWKQLKCPITEKWLNKLQGFHLAEHYGVIKNYVFKEDLSLWENAQHTRHAVK